MDGIDWIGDSEEWPEGIGDFAKNVFLPHTAALSLAEKVLDRGRGGRKVVSHTQPPPVAQSARDVQGQFAGLLRTVKGVEEKLDQTTRQLALLQRASSGSQDAERFQQSLSTAVLAVAPLLEQRNYVGAGAHVLPVLQNGKGFGAAVATQPISTFAFPLAAVAAYLARAPRKPEIIVSTVKTKNNAVRVTMISPDGGDIRYELGGTKEVSKDSTKYSGPFDVAKAFPNEKLRARVYTFLRGSEVAEVLFDPS